MNSHFKDMVESFAQKREVAFTSFDEKYIRGLERDLDNGKNDIDKTIRMLKLKFSYHLRPEDYKEIEKNLKRK